MGGRGRTIGIGIAAAMVLVAVAAGCGGSSSGTPAPGADADAGAIEVESDPATAWVATSAYGDRVAFASSVAWDQGIDESWVGWSRAGDPSITVLPDPPIDDPFTEPALQVTGTAILLIATTCPEPARDDDDASCAQGEDIALSYDIASHEWSSFDPPPLPEGQRLAIGMLDGTPTFGVLAPTGPGSSAELVAFAQGSGVAPWIAIPAPPLLDVVDACVTDDGLVAVENPEFGGFVNAGEKTFEELEEERRQLDELVDGSMDAARYDPAARSWARTEVTASRGVGAVSCQAPGVVFTRGSTGLVVQPAAGPATTFTASGEIGPNPSVVDVDGALVATYATDLADPQVEQVRATGGRPGRSTRVEGGGFPVAAFDLGDRAYWAAIADQHLELRPIAPS